MLEDMINISDDFDKDIEVNIVRLGLFKEEMCRDRRIRKTIFHKIFILDRGKALLPNELKKKYRNQKICYCSHEHDFNRTITTVFHELYHFNDPFDFALCSQKKEEKRNNLNLTGNLKYNIKSYLSEFVAEYKVAKKFSTQSQFKKICIDKAKNFIDNDRKNFFNKHIRGKDDKLCNLIPNKLSMNKIFRKKFEYLFRFLGIWRGFKKTNEFFSLQENWKNFIYKIRNDEFLPQYLLKFLKEILLNKKTKKLENKIFRKFKLYFRTHLYFNFNSEI